MSGEARLLAARAQQVAAWGVNVTPSVFEQLADQVDLEAMRSDS